MTAFASKIHMPAYSPRLKRPHSNTEILNSGKTYKSDISAHPCDLSVALARHLIDILKQHQSGSLIDSKSLCNSSGFIKFSLNVCALQKVELKDLSPQERTIFFVNIYNVLNIHTYLIKGEPRNLTERKEILNHQYYIGSQGYSARAIYGILRGAEDSGSSGNLETHPKEETQCHVDPRIHFCLFSGTNNSPIFRPYSRDHFFEDEIKEQSTLFLDQHLDLRSTRYEIWLPGFLKSYAGDFPKGLVPVLEEHTGRSEVKKFLKKYQDNCEIKFSENAYDKIPYVK
eukprot:TRINITY_DN9380_c0_g1_i2.p1 TRINITY_DN9380_c0_g1~~TRINITY_DN9380_c0_g1_i2.p1  ORF type:complete len:296 (+),score=80.56 TRINITY_DN9380_c0_g1_i2:34-888(+)